MARMTKADRDDLRRLVRERATLGKRMAEQRTAELLADAEAQIASIYKFDDEAWRDVSNTALQAVKVADEEIARRCRELGIPEDFRPKLELGWYGRGENAVASRRAELHRVCKSRAVAMQAAAISKIEAAKLDGLTLLTRDGLESEAAHTFLDSMPTAEALMPPLDVPQLISDARRNKPAPALTMAEIAAVMADEATPDA